MSHSNSGRGLSELQVFCTQKMGCYYPFFFCSLASTPSANEPAKDLILVHTVQLKPMIKAQISGRILSSGISDVVIASVHSEKTRLKKLIITKKKFENMCSESEQCLYKGTHYVGIVVIHCLHHSGADLGILIGGFFFRECISNNHLISI